MSKNQMYDYAERLSELLTVSVRQSGAEYGLLPVQIQTLHYLSVCNRYSDTPMAVTEYLAQTKGTVSQTIKVLERKGLLEKVLDENDRRMVHLSVTEAGAQILEKIVPNEHFAKAVNGLSQSQVDAVEGALKLLLTNMIQANQMKSFGVCHSCRYHQQRGQQEFFCTLLEEPLRASQVSKICREHAV